MRRVTPSSILWKLVFAPLFFSNFVFEPQTQLLHHKFSSWMKISNIVLSAVACATLGQLQSWTEVYLPSLALLILFGNTTFVFSEYRLILSYWQVHAILKDLVRKAISETHVSLSCYYYHNKIIQTNTLYQACLHSAGLESIQLFSKLAELGSMFGVFLLLNM